MGQDRLSNLALLAIERKLVKSLEKKANCAGVGHTGTLIALDHVIHQIDRTNSVNVYKIVCDLRMHRPLMVQSERVVIPLFSLERSRRRSKLKVQLRERVGLTSRGGDSSLAAGASG
ncbi:PTPRJ phosphatase, partial [Polypterus senegalus]